MSHVLETGANRTRNHLTQGNTECAVKEQGQVNMLRSMTLGRVCHPLGTDTPTSDGSRSKLGNAAGKIVPCQPRFVNLNLSSSHALQWCNHGSSADSDPKHKTSNDDLGHRVARSNDDSPGRKEHIGNSHTPLAPNLVSQNTQDKTTKDGSNRCRRGDDLHLGIGKLVTQIKTNEWQSSANNTSVVAKEETGDRSLSTSSVWVSESLTPYNVFY